VRVAALSDIHGNLPALEAVLVDVGREGVDTVVVAGDSVSGPWPAEVFDRLADIGALVVRGNADRPEEVMRHASDLDAWNEEHLDAARRAGVSESPLTLELEVEGLGAVLVCHATPESDEPIYTRITPDGDLADLFRGVTADVLVCGQTHMQYDRVLSSGLRVVNPGSVGMPYEGQPGAFWAVLGPGVEFRSSEYDVHATVEAIRARGAPVEDELISYLVEPPTSESVTARFEEIRGA